MQTNTVLKKSIHPIIEFHRRWKYIGTFCFQIAVSIFFNFLDFKFFTWKKLKWCKSILRRTSGCMTCKIYPRVTCNAQNVCIIYSRMTCESWMTYISYPRMTCGQFNLKNKINQHCWVCDCKTFSRRNKLHYWIK